MIDKPDDGPAFPAVGIRQVSPGGKYREVAGRGMSLRAYAAIHLRVPDSGTPWLDDMIRQSLRREFAKAALTGVCANSALRQDTSPEPYARVARGLADAALAELEKKGGG